MPQEIEITYSKQPQGQVGTIPRRIPLKEAFRFTTKDAGVLTIEFTGDSPLGDDHPRKEGKLVPLEAGKDFVAKKPGRYPFTCTLENEGVKRTLGIAAVPTSEVGGELEVPPDE